MTPAPRDGPVRASGQPPEPPLGLPPAPRASEAAVSAPLVAAGSPPTPTGAAEPSSPPPPGEAVALPSGTALAPPAPSLGAAEADGAACAPGAADGVTVTLADGPALGAEGAADGALEGAGCASGAADGVTAGLASVGTST